VELTRGVYSELEDTLLTTRALDYLLAGPADVVDLIGHVCSLPGAPRIVAEHMAHAMFAGRPQFARRGDGRWMLADVRPKPYAAQTRRSHSQSHGADDPLNGLSYVVVDTETTGGASWLGDRITEIAAVVVRGAEIVEVYETLVNPQRSIPPFVTRLTNITWDMVKDAPTFDRIAPDVMRVLEGNVFVAHNATFDWRFITNELSRSTGRQLNGRRLCTVKIARKVLPQLPRRSLDYVARYYGVEIHNRHRAAGDAIATAKCLIRMMSDLQDRGCGTWSELQTLLRTPPGRRKKRRPSGLPTPVTRDTTA
jgi:DNA polymerase III subunit epsilon